jgi:hypothetical protein
MVAGCSVRFMIRELSEQTYWQITVNTVCIPPFDAEVYFILAWLVWS